MLSRRAVLAGAGGSLIAGQTTGPDTFADAKAYDRFMGRWSRRLAPLFIEFADISNDARVLDVGCGTGALTMAIANRKMASKVVGLDLSKQYIEYARSHNPLNRVRFEVGDAQSLGFPDGSFDSAVSLLVFNFISEPNRAITELKRVTAPGGRISAAVWDYGEGMQMLRVFWDAAIALKPEAEAKDEKNFPLCRSGALKQLWVDAGLARIDERPLEMRMDFASFDDYWEPFTFGQGPAGAYVSSLDSTERTRLRNELKKRLHIARNTDSVSLLARAWAVRGDVV
jgi:SAM-dependent methyltransferase